MNSWNGVQTGKCVECGLNEILDNLGYCRLCDTRLKRQKETGRCGWCGMPVLQCVCDDDDYNDYGVW